MRVLQQYRFNIRTKIPFDQWPAIIENYLHDQNLHHHSFHYYLECYDDSDRCRSVLDGIKCRTCRSSQSYCEQCRKEASAALRKGTACERAVKENPFLGAIHTQQTQYDTTQSLHNFSEQSNRTKEDIYAICTKLYRRYGFSKSTLLYRDIDFFGRRVPTSTPDPEHFYYGYQGSGITLFRSCLSNDNAIILTVESLWPGDVPDATPYADALSAYLPGIKRTAYTKLIMDDDDPAYYDALHRMAAPLVVQAGRFFDDHSPKICGSTTPDTKVSTAALLKKFGKQYGYTYRGYDYYVYSMEKRLPGGHCLCLDFVSSPSIPRADPCISLCGLGFRHDIWAADFIPQNTQHFSDYLTQLFDCLAEAEQTVFPALLDLYPQTPDWFVPAHT
ncbi:MAG: hypothetical protein IJY28_08255 [Clostridia bacterium]|nr:hypothetical protein [Clostridia bacterium]